MMGNTQPRVRRAASTQSRMKMVPKKSSYQGGLIPILPILVNQVVRTYIPRNREIPASR